MLLRQRIAARTPRLPFLRPLSSATQSAAPAGHGTTHLQRTAQEPRPNAEYLDAEVTYVVQETPTVKRLGIRTHAPFTFTPGQWVDFRVPGLDTVGGFSIASAPSMLPTVELAIRRSFNPPAVWAHDHCQAGAALQLRVGGAFTLQSPGFQEPTILIAGGMGINPILSMLLAHAEHVLAQPPEQRHSPPIFLFYSCKSWEEAVYLPQLLRLWSLLPKHSFYLAVTFTQNHHVPDTIVQYSWEGVYGGSRAYTPLLLRGDDGGTPQPPELELPETTRVYQVTADSGERKLLSEYDEDEGKELLADDAAGGSEEAAGAEDTGRTASDKEGDGADVPRAASDHEDMASALPSALSPYRDEELEAMSLSELAAAVPEECDWSRLAWLTSLDDAEPLALVRKAQGRQILSDFYAGELSEDAFNGAQDPLAYGNEVDGHGVYKPSLEKMLRGSLLQTHRHSGGEGEVQQADGSLAVLPKNAADVLAAGFAGQSLFRSSFGATLARETLAFTSGRVSAEAVHDVAAAAQVDADAAEVWLCGPAAMTEALAPALSHYKTVHMERWE